MSKKQYIRLKLSAIEHDIAVAKAVGNNDLCNSLMSYFADDISMTNVVIDYMDLMEADGRVTKLLCSLDGRQPFEMSVIINDNDVVKSGKYYYILELLNDIVLYRLKDISVIKLPRYRSVYNFVSVKNVLNENEKVTLF